MPAPVHTITRTGVIIDGVWIVIGCIGLFDTGRDYILQFNITHTHTLLSTVTSSLAVAR
jgi:hypothetical protein